MLTTRPEYSPVLSGQDKDVPYELAPHSNNLPYTKKYACRHVSALAVLADVRIAPPLASVYQSPPGFDRAFPSTRDAPSEGKFAVAAIWGGCPHVSPGFVWEAKLLDWPAEAVLSANCMANLMRRCSYKQSRPFAMVSSSTVHHC